MCTDNGEQSTILGLAINRQTIGSIHRCLCLPLHMLQTCFLTKKIAMWCWVKSWTTFPPNFFSKNQNTACLLLVVLCNLYAPTAAVPHPCMSLSARLMFSHRFHHKADPPSNVFCFCFFNSDFWIYILSVWGRQSHRFHPASDLQSKLSSSTCFPSKGFQQWKWKICTFLVVFHCFRVLGSLCPSGHSTLVHVGPAYSRSP